MTYSHLEQMLVDALPAQLQETDPGGLQSVLAHARWVSLDRGDVLFRRGDEADALYVVVHGRLAVLPSDRNAPASAHLGPGQTVGDWAVLTDARRSADVVATRPTTLARLDRQRFERFANQNAPFMRSMAAEVVRQHRDAGATRSTAAIVTVIHLDEHDGTAVFAKDLAVGLERLSPTDIAGEQHAPDDREMWLGDLERRAKIVLLSAPQTGSWQDWCVKHADHVVLLASADSSSTPTAAERRLYEGDPRLRPLTTLVLLHDPQTELPNGTMRWLEPRQLSAHYHARLHHAGDSQRIARSIMGQGIGLVLAGGAALGAAHVGVIAALMQRGVPVDFVGGTSSGGGIAGTIARFAQFEDIHDVLVRAFVETNPFKKFTLPVLSIISAHGVDATAKLMCADVQIEDLWLPYFAVSTDIQTAEPFLHRTGSLWKATRATTAVPGLLPAMVLDGKVLVDGGVLDNFPTQKMKRLCGGPVIGSDIAAPGARRPMDIAYEDLPSPLTALLRPSPHLPTISHVLLRIASLGSKSNHADNVNACDLHLEPPVRAYSPKDFAAFGDIAGHGYAHTMARLSSIDLSRLIPGWGPGLATCHSAPHSQLGAVTARFGIRSDKLPRPSMLSSQSFFEFTQKLTIQKVVNAAAGLRNEHMTRPPVAAAVLQSHKGSKVMQWLFNIQGSHHQRQLGFCAYGWKDFSTLLMFKVRQMAHRQDRPFADHEDWRQLYDKLHTPSFVAMPHHSEEPACIEWIVGQAYGSLLTHKVGHQYVVDTSELCPFVRHGDDTLRVRAWFGPVEGGIRLQKLEHDGVEYTQFDTAEARHALRASTVGVFTVATVRYHYAYCHFEASNHYATFAVQHIPRDHPVRRMLSFLEYDALIGSDQGGLTLQEYGFPSFTNLDKPGLEGYLGWSRAEFDLLKVFHLPTSLVRSGITSVDHALDVPDCLPLLQVSAQWWSVFEEYVRSYLSIYYTDDHDLDAPTRRWLGRLGREMCSLCPEDGVLEYLVRMCTSLLYSVVVHEICFNRYSMNADPFRFSTRLRQGELGAGRLEWRKEWMLRMAASQSVNLPSVSFAADLTDAGRDTEAKAVLAALSERVTALDAVIRERWPQHRILLPENVKCSARW